MFFLGWQVGVAANRMMPPEMRLFSLAPKEFLMVPLVSIVAFLLFVMIGVWQRKRPEIHKPMMLVATLTACSAAFGRIEILYSWYAGTALEVWFTAFLSMLLIGVLLLVIKSALSKSLDRWLAIAIGLLAVISVAGSLMAKTSAWDQFASYLLR
jgi:small basic protein